MALQGLLQGAVPRAEVEHDLQGLVERCQINVQRVEPGCQQLYMSIEK